MMMRSTKYMERILQEEVETLKRKGKLATEAVNEFVQSVEKRVLQRTSFEVQDHFSELQDLVRNACTALQRVIIGLAEMAPSPDNNQELSFTATVRPMIAPETMSTSVWNNNDGLADHHHTDRAANSLSPDIIESASESLPKPSISSASSTSSTLRSRVSSKFSYVRDADISAKTAQSALEDEFAMKVPAHAPALNVDAPAFTPAAFEKMPARSSSVSRGSLSSYDEAVPHEKAVQNECEDHVNEREDAPPAQTAVRQQPRSNETVEPSRTKLTSSRVESHSFLKCADSAPKTDASVNEEESSLEELQGSAGSAAAFSALSRELEGCNDADKLAAKTTPERSGDSHNQNHDDSDNQNHDDSDNQNDDVMHKDNDSDNAYPAEATSRPSSHSKRTAHNTEQILKDTAQVLRENKDLFSAERSGERQVDWSSKQTPGELPKNFRRTRVPPLWTYVEVSFSDVNAATGRIYVQLFNDEAIINGLCNEINFPQNHAKTPLKMEDISKELIVTAPYIEHLDADTMRYRAEITSIGSEHEIGVFFLDYGNTDVVRLEDLSLDSSRTFTRTCRMAIPCQLDKSLQREISPKDLPERAYVCFANPVVVDGETVFTIMDIMGSSSENFLELPESEPFTASDIGNFDYSVVVTHASSPRSMWLVETKDMDVPNKVEAILCRLPPEACSAKLAVKSTYLVHDDQRAMVLDSHADGQLLDLLLIESGKSVQSVPISACRRLPLAALLIPPAAKVVCLANCLMNVTEDDMQTVMASIIGTQFEMKVKKGESDEVIMVYPDSRKYLAKQLEARFGANKKKP